jgi:hypothetical protein
MWFFFSGSLGWGITDVPETQVEAEWRGEVHAFFLLTMWSVWKLNVKSKWCSISRNSGCRWAHPAPCSVPCLEWSYQKYYKKNQNPTSSGTRMCLRYRNSSPRSIPGISEPTTKIIWNLHTVHIFLGRRSIVFMFLKKIISTALKKPIIFQSN